MYENQLLAERFEANRSQLRSVAYRMLGSLAEAEDAVQEAWLRLSRSNASDIENLGGWLTTVVGRICLDMLRSRKSRREEYLGERVTEPVASNVPGADPEQEALLADSVGIALLVVLEKLTPAERLAFVLHDVFAVPFDEIAPIVDRSPSATRQLASRARRRVQGTETVTDVDVTGQREVVDAFLAAARGGDFNALVAVLDPDVVIRTDTVTTLPGGVNEIRGANLVAERAIKTGARAARPALINGEVGLIVAPRGRLLLVLQFNYQDGKVVGIDAIGEPERLAQLDLAVLSA